MSPQPNQPPPESFSDEWNRFLNEVRVVLPGVQLLFAFLITVPFTSKFSELSINGRRVYFCCFLCTTAATAFLCAPAVYHRLHWRRDVVDKEEMLRTSNRLAIVGGVLLAVAMTLAVFVLSTLIFDPWLGWSLSAVSALMFGYLWFGLPLNRRQRDLKR